LADDPDRIRILPDLGEALEELGEFDEAQRVLNEAIESARALGDQALAAEAEMVLLSVKLYLGEEEGWAEAVDVAVSSARPIFEAARDDIGLTRANRLLFASHASAMRLGMATQAAEQVIAHAQAARDQRLERRGAMAYAQAALYGPTPVPEAIAQCERLVASADGDRRTQALLQTWLAQLYAMNGELDRARTTYAAASAMIAELREGEASLLRPSTEQAQIELLGGDLATAEEALRRDYDALTAIGERYILSGVVGLLAKVLVAESRTDEVDDLTRTLEELAAPDDVAAQVDWRGLRALSRVAQGKLDEAEQLAREAVELALTAEGPVLQAEAFERLAAVQSAAGNAAAADATLVEAIRRYRDKGEVVSVARLTRAV
jgi:tetratricopeptide (TPR) repeat protein